MNSSTLIAHSPKFASKLVSRDALIALPEPQALGVRHKPVPHHELLTAITEEIERRDYKIVREQLALGAKGAALFGVLDLAEAVQKDGQPERGVSFGFRTSTNSTLSIKAVAGQRVFVCDNLALSGSMIAFQRKSTTLLDLKHVISLGVDKFIEHEYALEIQIEELGARMLTDGQAKEKIFDIFNQGLVPVRLFPDVARAYFQPLESETDCQPRSEWGLHNAFTRAMRDLTPVSLFNASVRLGRAFGIGEVVDGEVISAPDDELGEEVA